MTINPPGYLYDLDGRSDECFIGISEIPESANQYRLGTIFLRNFYTALDFDENLIAVGINKNIPEKDRPTMEGISLAGRKPAKDHSGLVIWIFVILTILFGVAIVFYVRANKEMEARKEQQDQNVEEEEEQNKEQKETNYLKSASNKKNKNLTVQQDNDLDESLAESIDEE